MIIQAKIVAELPLQTQIIEGHFTIQCICEKLEKIWMVINKKAFMYRNAVWYWDYSLLCDLAR